MTIYFLFHKIVAAVKDLPKESIHLYSKGIYYIKCKHKLETYFKEVDGETRRKGLHWHPLLIN